MSRTTKMMAQFALIWVVAAILVLPAWAQIGQVGKPPVYPAGGAINEEYNYNMTVMVGEPEVEFFMDGDKEKATITFTTLEPTNHAKVYYGVMEPDNSRPMPRYRRYTGASLVEGATSTYSATIDVYKFMTSYDPQGYYATHKGGVIPFRIEIWADWRGRMEVYDRQFAFRGAQRVPCIAEGPFVSLVEENSATVWFETDTSVPARVVTDYGTFDSPSAARHEVALTGLPKGARVAYYVEVGAGDASSRSRDLHFETQDGGRYFKFAIYSDSREGVGGGLQNYYGVNAEVMRALSLSAYDHGANLVFFVGDLINGYSSDETDQRMQFRSWNRTVEPVAGYIPFVPTFGNHEWFIDWYHDAAKDKNIAFDKPYPNDAQTLFSSEYVLPRNGCGPETGGPPYGETSYYYDYNNVRFIAVNSNYWYTSKYFEEYGGVPQGYVCDKQLAWIKQVVAEGQSDPKIEHIFLGTHEPTFPCGGHTQDAFWYNGGDPDQNGGVDRSYIFQRRDEMWEFLSRHDKVVAFLHGDEHNYARLQVDSRVPVYPDGSTNSDFVHPIWMIISGGAGAPFYAQNMDMPWAHDVAAFSTQSHYCLFTVNGERVTLDVISVNGAVIDRAVLREGKPLITDVEEAAQTESAPSSYAPSGYALRQNYPNPFNPTTVIEFDLSAGDHVTVEVFNTVGQRVAVLHDGAMAAGTHRMIWDGKNSLGERCAAGVYVYTARTSRGILSQKKMVMLK